MSTTRALTIDDLDRARLDPVVFADQLIGQPLWDHQIEVVRSAARYRVICAGRRAGKTRVFGVLSLHQAFSVPRSKVLIVSVSETAAKRMFADILEMATSSPYLSTSIDDDTTHAMALSNGSRIECVPSSMKAVRSAEADLLIVDEAGFVDQSIWEAAEPIVAARPGSRVLLASSPWGSSEHFFRSLWAEGMASPSEGLRAWHWPSSVNPNVDPEWLESVRRRSAPDYFEREYLAVWTEEAGAYLTEAELMSCVADYEMTPPEEVDRWVDRPYTVVAGVDWGVRRDANVVMLLAVCEDERLNVARSGGELVFFVPWFEARHGWAYTDFIDRIVEIGRRYQLRVVAAETNGVGAFPTDELRRRAYNADLDSWIYPVTTDAKRKQSGYGKLKGLLQQRRLVLPREPELLKQLRGLTFEQLPSGNVRIAVPDSAGHDDIADALMQAVSCVVLEGAERESWRLSGSAADWAWSQASERRYSGDVVVTRDHVTGEELVRLPLRPTPVPWHTAAYITPEGREKGDLW